MNINLAPIVVLIQQINSGRFNSISLFIIGVFIILIINVIITSQSFINLIIKIENLIIDLFFIFNGSINLSQSENIESNIKQQMNQTSKLKLRLSKTEHNRQHKYSFFNLNGGLLNQFKINQMIFGRGFSTSNINLNNKDKDMIHNSKDQNIKDHNLSKNSNLLIILILINLLLVLKIFKILISKYN
jgi:hypothetical protein